MSVTIPEVSAVSWSSFMTGTDAGNHGIFGFVDLVPGKYQYRFPDFNDLRRPTFFDELGLINRRSVIVNLPATYPARPIHGVLISGFMALDLKKAVYPSAYYPLLKRLDYRIDNDTGKGKEKKNEFLADLHYTLKIRQQAADLLLDQEEWDLFMFTVTETDRLQHFLFDAYVNDRHPLHEEFLQLYRDIDGLVGRLLERAQAKGEVDVMMLSDHGFCPIGNEVYLNPILRRHGFFASDDQAGHGLTGISAKARAFALDPSRIYLHRRDRYFRGPVTAKDYEPLRRDLRQLFESYQIAGQPVIRKVFFKEEIYSPPLRESAPDLVLLSYPGYDLKAGVGKSEEFGRSHLSGMHQQDNAFFFCSRPELVSEPMTITDCKKTIFRMLRI